MRPATLNLNQLNEALSEVAYRPGWRLVARELDDHQGPYLSVYAEVPNAYAPDQTVELRIHSPIPPVHSEDAFYEWLLWRLRVIETHECLEWFRVAGRPWIDPHADLD